MKDKEQQRKILRGKRRRDDIQILSSIGNAATQAEVGVFVNPLAVEFI